MLCVPSPNHMSLDSDKLLRPWCFPGCSRRAPTALFNRHGHVELALPSVKAPARNNLGCCMRRHEHKADQAKAPILQQLPSNTDLSPPEEDTCMAEAAQRGRGRNVTLQHHHQAEQQAFLHKRSPGRIFLPVTIVTRYNTGYRPVSSSFEARAIEHHEQSSP
jgi:hypothetical protein